MGRTAILVGKINGKWDFVGYSDYKSLDNLLRDRIANSLAFPEEHIQRLPSRLGVDMYRIGKLMQEPYLSNARLEPPHIVSRYHADGHRNINVS